MYTFSSDWIHQLEGKQHWIYYWHQIHQIRSRIKEGDTVLEIGVGTKFTSNYLKSKGYKVVTIDIDPEKEPDLLGNIVEVQLPESYDFILAYEVFEHIPFEDFVKVLHNLGPVCRRYLLMSLPRNEKFWFELSATLPGNRQLGFRIATLRKKIITRNHHWEVDYSPYTKKRIAETIRKESFKIESVEKVSSLYFYALEKSD